MTTLEVVFFQGVAFIVEVVARDKAVMGREIVEEALVVGTLTIFEAFELNLTRLLFFSVVDLLAEVGEIAWTEMVENIELKSPDNVGGIFDVARLLETLEGDGANVVVAVEAADDEKSSIGVALELFKLANRIVNAEFSRIPVETNDRSVGFVGTKRLEKSKQLVDRFVLKF